MFLKSFTVKEDPPVLEELGEEEKHEYTLTDTHHRLPEP